MREQKQNYFFDAVILVAALLMLYPIFWLLFSAFKPSSDIFRTATELIPRSWTLENFTGFEGIADSFIRYIFNSLQIALISMVGRSVLRLSFLMDLVEFLSKEKVLVCLYLGHDDAAAEIIMVPQYLWFNQLGWLNSIRPVTVPSYFGQAFFIL